VNLTFMNLVVLFSLGFVMCIFVMAGMVIGAFVVYRTKREAHDPFLVMRKTQGDAFQAPGEYIHERGDEEEDLPDGTDLTNIIYGTPERRQQAERDIFNQLARNNKGESQ
jgi:hypothetical protein